MEIQRIGRIPTNEDLRLYLDERIIPVRFCYPEEGGNKWHKLRQDEAYSLGERELRAFREGLTSIEDILRKQPINLVHLGPGDGIEIPILFDRFKPNCNGKYAGVDISEQMIYNTARLNDPHFSGANPLWYLTDIETKGNLESVCEDIKKKGVNRNLILLTNQGVLFSNPETLQNVYASMRERDYLFITIEGDDPKRRDEILTTYDLREVRDLLSEGLKRAGYISEDGNFRATFNEVESRVEVYFKPENEQDILCLTSYKPKEDEFKQRLSNSGFDIQFFRFYEDVHTFAVLCSKGEKNV